MKTLPIEFVNRNGLTLRGIATMPDGEGHFPTVINLHGFGGMKAGYKGLHITMARALAEEGSAASVLIFPITARATENLKT